MSVIVTRPLREAARWVQALRDHGIAAEALPLIAIAPAPDAQAVARAWQSLPQCAAAMFVSAQAAAGFFEAGAPAALQALRTRAWATGPGTRDALLAAGWPAARIDAPCDAAPQFDSEALWSVVRGQLQPGDRVLIVRGGDAGGEPAGRDWLAQQLRQAGAEVAQVASYVRQRPVWSPVQCSRAGAAAQDGSWWLFSSSQALGHLRTLVPDQDWSRARAVATHPRIAQAARAAGFGEVAQSRPTLAALLAFLQSRG
ncbi:uroporphyrinogen-III synthase [Ramlibacter tataouinensis]|uniref:Uroporphyrinogen-III synthase n=1 Tax=Ramlibacter tataouinensis (strain ATCC BAA-407 / DSM 14655 / LMG 21543 / TTB310) TaxID=365046 RepID=F5Y5T6_RAMTT|nr:uroporphyrinogen-III synthase [Ramlibacter tataouinensis]AEG93970.1 Hydroxymethylbilane hydrolyase (cyclizing) [Ramlibacter tataouinensis TTB310]